MFCIPILDNLVLKEEVDVVNPIIPRIIEIDLVGKYKMIVNNVENVLQGPRFGCKVPLARERGIFTSRVGNTSQDSTYVFRNC